MEQHGFRAARTRCGRAVRVVGLFAAVGALSLCLTACSFDIPGKLLPNQQQASSQDLPRAIRSAIIEHTPSSFDFVREHPDVSALPAGTVLDPDVVALYGEDACFTAQPIFDEVFARINGISFPTNGEIPLDSLRYVRVLHQNEEGQTKIGEIIVNTAIADEVLDIFRQLYHAQYPIEKMHLVDDYGGSDDASMSDNNTSSFNYRLIEGTNMLSYHARGLAIDINPLYNPFIISSRNYISPPESVPYTDRSKSFPYKLDEGDLCYRLFMERGYVWGGSWTDRKDYQHFEKHL